MSGETSKPGRGRVPRHGLTIQQADVVFGTRESVAAMRVAASCGVRGRDWCLDAQRIGWKERSPMATLLRSGFSALVPNCGTFSRLSCLHQVSPHNTAKGHAHDSHAKGDARSYATMGAYWAIFAVCYWLGLGNRVASSFQKNGRSNRNTTIIDIPLHPCSPAGLLLHADCGKQRGASFTHRA